MVIIQILKKKIPVYTCQGVNFHVGFAAFIDFSQKHLLKTLIASHGMEPARQIFSISWADAGKCPHDIRNAQ